jgi:hypothetical protein
MSTMQSVIDRFVHYYAELDSQPPSALSALYHPDAVLQDPFGEHHGFVAIHRYFTHLLANVEQCRFAIDPPLCDGQRFAVTWTMHWSHPHIRGNEPHAARLLGRGSAGEHVSISVIITTPGRCCMSIFPYWAVRCEKEGRA